MHDTLMDEIASYFHESCISDLHYIAHPDLICGIQAMDTGKYSMEEWNYTLSYILSRDVHLTSLSDLEGIFKKDENQK